MQSMNSAPKKLFEGKHSELNEKIIKVFYEVHNELGYGFSEIIYLKAFKIALESIGLTVGKQVPINVYFRGQMIGEYFADLVVNDLIMLELKSVSQIIEEHETQLLNYLK